MTAMFGGAAGYAYLRGQLAPLLAGVDGRGGAVKVRAIYRTIMLAQAREPDTVTAPAILIAYLHGSDSYTFGERREGRSHYATEHYAVRAVHDSASSAASDEVAAAIDEILNPGDEAQLMLPETDDPPDPDTRTRYDVITCTRVAPMSTTEKTPAKNVPSGAVRWLIGGQYRLVIGGG